MTLVAGTRLGPYTVVAPLGAGGMGEVYRARDARLDREVAVKVLPAAFSGDADRLRRFEQETHAAGQLNHPNLLAVYDVGTHDGSPYIVSELLDGETSPRADGGYGAGGTQSDRVCAPDRARAGGGARERDRASRSQAGESLRHPRRTGEDSRLRTRQAGPARYWDSGLAGRFHTAGRHESGSGAGHRGLHVPEQVRGEPADHRSDIFSFGAILYEMLAGQRAFRRDSAAETMTAILKEDPPILTGIQPKVPLGLERIAAHCLEKRPEERFQSVRDLAFALEALSGSSMSGAGGLPLAAANSRHRVLRTVAVVLPVLLLAGALFLLGKRSRGAAIPKFQRLTFQSGHVISARFAPDGQTVLYTQKVGADPSRVFSTRLGNPESSCLPFPAARLLSVSRSGELAIQLAPQPTRGFLYLGTLARAPMAGAAPREVLEGVQWADWARDGQSMLVVRDVEGRTRLEFPVGRSLHQADGWISHPRVSPRGDEVAFVEQARFDDDAGSVVVVDPAGRARTLSSWISVQGLAWSPKGREVWFTAAREGVSRGLYAVSRAGKERLIARVTGTLQLHDLAGDGRGLLTQEQVRTRIACLAPGETAERDLSWLDVSLVRDISDDGRMILFGESGEGAGASYDVYVRRTDGSPPVRLGEGSPLDLSPDGRWALMETNSSPPQLVLLPTGPGEPRQLTQGPMGHYDAVFFPDGRRILFMGNEAGKEIRCYVQDLEGGEPRPVAPVGSHFRRFLHPLSPDGKLLALRDAGGRVSIWPLDGSEARPVSGLALEEGIAGWTPDGRGLFVWGPSRWPVRVERLDLATGRRELWREITPADPSGIRGIYPLVITPDGKCYAYSYTSILSDLYLAEGLR